MRFMLETPTQFLDLGPSFQFRGEPEGLIQLLVRLFPAVQRSIDHGCVKADFRLLGVEPDSLRKQLRCDLVIAEEMFGPRERVEGRAESRSQRHGAPGKW